MTKKIVRIGKKHNIRGFDIDFDMGRIFLADYDRGNFYQYSI